MSKLLDMMLALAGNATTKDATATNTPPLDDNTKKLATTEFLRNEFIGTGKRLLNQQGGYYTLPGGLIFQWGIVNAVPNGSGQFVSLPKTFPNAILAAGATIGNTGGNSNAMSAGVGNIGPSSITVFHNGNTNLSTAIHWWVLGH